MILVLLSILIQPEPYLGEFDFFLVNHTGRGAIASAIHKPASISNQDNVRPLHRLTKSAGQCVPHLEFQGSSIGINLKKQQQHMEWFSCIPVTINNLTKTL